MTPEPANRGQFESILELLRAGELRAALSTCDQLLADHPGDINLMGLKAVALGDLGEIAAARSVLEEVIEQAPDFAKPHEDLGTLQLKSGNAEQSLQSFQRAIELDPGLATAHYQMGRAYAALARPRKAASAYQRCLEVAPDNAAAWLGLGHIHNILGREQESITAFQQSLRHDPGLSEAYYSLANLKAHQLSDAEVDAMVCQLERSDLPAKSRVNLLFALGKTFEDRNRYPRAWEYYAQGNAAQRKRVNYDPVNTEAVVDQLVNFFTASYFSSLDAPGCPERAPIFLVGMRRSGASLVEKVVRGHSQVESTGELPYLGRIAQSLGGGAEPGARYPEALADLNPRQRYELGEHYLELANHNRREGLTHFIDRTPGNYLLLGFIHSILPNAKIIDVRRHPMDTCVGNLKQLFPRGQAFSYDQTEMGEYYLQYLRIMDHWHQVLPNKVLQVQYEDLVEDFEAGVLRILRYLGLPWDENCLNFHEHGRVKKTTGTAEMPDSSQSAGIGLWRRYEAGLDELTAVLQPVLSQLERDP